MVFALKSGLLEEIAHGDKTARECAYAELTLIYQDLPFPTEGENEQALREKLIDSLNHCESPYLRSFTVDGLVKLAWEAYETCEIIEGIRKHRRPRKKTLARAQDDGKLTLHEELDVAAEKRRQNEEPPKAG